MCIMDKQRAELQGMLMEERMTPGGLEAACRAKRSKQCFSLVVAVMGLLVVFLMTAFILCYQKPMCNQNSTSFLTAPPVRSPAIFTNCTWKEINSRIICDLFTPETAGTYSVLGHVKFSGPTGERFDLIQRCTDSEDTRTMKTNNNVNQTQVFFYDTTNLLPNKILSLRFGSTKPKSLEEILFYMSKQEDF